MKKKPIFFKLTGIACSAAFILTACNTATSTATPVSTTATQAPAASLVASTATLPPAATATATPVPTTTVTQAPTTSSVPTATSALTTTLAPVTTTQTIAQVVPSVNAYCRKGPGTDYYAITFLQQGTAYNVVGRNGLNTWWLVQAPGNVTCWEGDPGSTQQGPVNQATIAAAQPLPVTPATFVGSYQCDTTLHTLAVVLNWSAVMNVTGYRIYRNDTQITDTPATSTAYSDSSAPTGTSLVYALEAYNDYGMAARITVSVPSCD